MSTPQLITLADKKTWYFSVAVLWFLFVIVFSPVGVVVGYGLHKLAERGRHVRQLVGVGVGISLFGLYQFFPVFWYDGKNFTAMLWQSLLLAPLAAALFRPFLRLLMFVKPPSLDDWLDRDRENQEKYERQLRAAVEAELRKKNTPTADSALTLGTVMQSEYFPPEFGIVKHGRWLQLAEWTLDQHMFILGATGAGKSETIKRLIFEVLANTERDIFLVDGKGDQGLASDVRLLCKSAGRDECPIFRMGTVEAGAAYDGFRGSAQDVYNRLCALIGVNEAEGNATFYADINRALLQLVCKAPPEPPRSFGDVIQRLDFDWLEEAYAGVPEKYDLIDKLREKAKQHVDGLFWRLVALSEALSELVSPEGFALEEVRGAIFSIRTQSVGDTGKRFLQFLVEDLKDFAGKRQQRPGMLIIDEFGAFGNDNIIALLTLARSAKLGVILATQDIASLGEEATTQLVLANTRTKFLMATDFAEQVGKLAGTIYQIESSIQHDQGEATGMGSARVQHTFKVDMNQARQLRAGEAFLIRQGHTAKLKIKRVGETQSR